MDGYILQIASRSKKDKDKGEESKGSKSESSSSYQEVIDSALDEMVDALELEGDKADSFKTALQDLVEACTCQHMDKAKAKKSKPAKDEDEETDE